MLFSLSGEFVFFQLHPLGEITSPFRRGGLAGQAFTDSHRYWRLDAGVEVGHQRRSIRAARRLKARPLVRGGRGHLLRIRYFCSTNPVSLPAEGPLFRFLLPFARLASRRRGVS